jgi:glutathione-independent formaldehyde dehydrogenase
MKAVVYEGPLSVAVQEIPRPTVMNPNDAVLRLTTSAICGSDLHMYDGHTTAEPGLIFGHEPMGVIEEVGAGVRLIRPGDRVVVPFNVAFGQCRYCVQGMSNACLTLNPENAGAAYGYVDMGPHAGGQAEYLRIPYADWACLKLPGEPFDDQEDEFVLLADIFPTGFHATELARVSPGKSVAVFGAGPVGLLAAYSAILEGAAEVYVVDCSKARLDKARSIGAVPINFNDGDPVEQITNLRRDDPQIKDSLRPGEEKLTGVDCGIDAVGYQALDRTDRNRSNPNQVLWDLARLINPGGHLGIIGVYLKEDPMGVNPEQKLGMATLPLGLLWTKGVSVGMGQTPVKTYHYQLRDMIMSGVAKPSFIITDRINLTKRRPRTRTSTSGTDRSRSSSDSSGERFDPSPRSGPAESPADRFRPPGRVNASGRHGGSPSAAVTAIRIRCRSPAPSPPARDSRSPPPSRRARGYRSGLP